MDFLTLCQALGLAIAVGILVGAVVPPVMPTWGVLAGAIPIGVAAAGFLLDGEGEDVWPAIVIGPLGAGLAGTVARDVTAGAARRAAGETRVSASAPAGVTALVAIAAAVIGVLSLLAPPSAVVAFVALVWLWLMRRRRAEQKHEGLRVLR